MPGNLILSRKLSERVVIDVKPSTAAHRIVVTLVEIDRHKVRLAFTADGTREEVMFARSELMPDYTEPAWVPKQAKGE